MTANGIASNMRPFDSVMHFLRSLHPCEVLSFFALSLLHPRAYLPLTLPSPVRYSLLTLRLSLSPHASTRSLYKDIARRKKRTEEREAPSLTVISPTNIYTQCVDNEDRDYTIQIHVRRVRNAHICFFKIYQHLPH